MESFIQDFSKLPVYDRAELFFLFMFVVAVWAPWIFMAIDAMLRRYRDWRNPPRKGGGLLI